MENSIKEGKIDELNYYVFDDRKKMGEEAAKRAADRMKQLLETKQEIRVVFAAAPSQDEFLSNLTSDKEIEWNRIVCFHMDEYLGLPSGSEQLFQKYLQHHVADKVNVKKFHFIDGSEDPEKELERYENLLKEEVVDLVFLGIGENGHIAFNDPPVADFNDPHLVKIVELDQYSRNQQVNDGCFPSIEEVPTHALTLTIPALTSAGSMICTVPGKLKSHAVRNTLHAEISTACPATILRKHQDAHLFLDFEAYGENKDE